MTNPEDLGAVVSSTTHPGFSKSGNLQRAEWRSKTRHVLADHLSKSNARSAIRLTKINMAESQLGISVEPANVRLMPGAGDGYVWSVLPEKKYLFSKQLSKHSIGAYTELCRGVGVSFEAVVVSESAKASATILQGGTDVVVRYVPFIKLCRILSDQNFT